MKSPLTIIVYDELWRVGQCFELEQDDRYRVLKHSVKLQLACGRGEDEIIFDGMNPGCFEVYLKWLREPDLQSTERLWELLKEVFEPEESRSIKGRIGLMRDLWDFAYWFMDDALEDSVIEAVVDWWMWRKGVTGWKEVMAPHMVVGTDDSD